MDNPDKIKRYIFSHNPQGLILDTNILILFLVGKCNKDLIKTHERLNNSDKEYTIEDYDFLCDIVSWFNNKLIITPQILSEISSLTIIQKQGIYDQRRDRYIASVIAVLKTSQEEYLNSNSLWGVEVKILKDLGFTDLNLLELAKVTKFPILTDDLPFFIHAQNKIPIINYQTIKYASLKVN